MRSLTLLVPFVATAFAARPFLNEADTGIEEVLGDTPAGTLPPLKDLVGLPDFEWAARRYLNASSYTYYRNGAAGEWSYRNNLEVYSRYRLRPRVVRDIVNVPNTLSTKILGYNFSTPFYISPCARAGLGHEQAERELMKGANKGDILYIEAQYSSATMEEIAAAKPKNSSQIHFQQVYLTSDDNVTRSVFRRTEETGAKAIIWTIDAAASGNRHRANRYGVGSAVGAFTLNTWDYYQHISNMTTLPIIPKGIMTVEDAREAIAAGCKAIILSNHGGRNLDFSPSPLEVALEIYEEDPSIFQQVEVWADGGIRYGTDILKLLALGVKAVGLGRPFMFANAYGADGVARMTELLKIELAKDAANLGVADLKKIDPSYVKWTPNNWSG